MQSIAEIVNIVNNALDLEGVKKYGIAQTVFRKVGGKEEKLPATVARDGKAEYVGIDDKYKISWYHKTNTMASRFITNSGFGRSAGKTVNTFGMSMIVFLNRKLVKKYPDEIIQIIQASTPELINKSIRISYNSSILNDSQVYSQEYLSDTYRLGPEHNLFQINYSLEVPLDKGCFNTCID